MVFPHVYLAGDVTSTLSGNHTGNLIATTPLQLADATITLPVTLKGSEGNDIPVTAIITNVSGTAITNGNLAAITFIVTYSSSGYEDITRALVATDSAITTAPDVQTSGQCDRKQDEWLYNHRYI